MTMMAPPDVAALALDVLAGKRRALAKAITLVESRRTDHQQAAEDLLRRLIKRTGRAHRVGISGVPGVGKSTFIDALGLHLLGIGCRVAVLAVDPSSRVSGGSILGDKTRMPRLSASTDAFIRPSPAAGSLGGVARHTREAMLVCEAAGFDVVIVETVGVGQSEHAVAQMVDSFLLLALAGAGDELQGIKRGILELVDVLCVNKADGDNVRRAESAAREHESAFRLLRSHDDHPPRVLTASAAEERGIAEVWAALAEHRAELASSGRLAQRRREQQREWLDALIREGLERALDADARTLSVRAQVESAVDSDEISAPEGARRVLAEFFRVGAERTQTSKA